MDRVHQRKLLKHIILDMDSSVSPTYGNQEGTAYNGYEKAGKIATAFKQYTEK